MPDLYEGRTFAALDEGTGHVSTARGLAATLDEAELFLYPGDRRLFTESSLRDYDEGAAGLVTERVLGFLTALG